MLDPEIPSSETIHRIPPKLRHCHLHNFDWGRLNVGEKGKEIVHEFLEQWKKGEDPHLICIGPPGVGKSHIGISVYRAGVYEADLTESVYIYVPEFCKAVKETFNDKNLPDPFLEIQNASLLILDDLFGRELSNWEIDQIIARLITTAYDNATALLVTTNYSVEWIGNKIHQHEDSRLFANSKTLIFKGEDQR